MKCFYFQMRKTNSNIQTSKHTALKRHNHNHTATTDTTTTQQPHERKPPMRSKIQTGVRHGSITAFMCADGMLVCVLCLIRDPVQNVKPARVFIVFFGRTRISRRVENQALETIRDDA